MVNNKGNIMSVKTEIQPEEIEEVVIPIRHLTKSRKRGMFRAASSTLSTSFEVMEDMADTVATTMEIASTALRVSLAETKAEGINDLMALGYSQTDAEKIVNGHR